MGEDCKRCVHYEDGKCELDFEIADTPPKLRQDYCDGFDSFGDEIVRIDAAKEILSRLLEMTVGGEIEFALEQSFDALTKMEKRYEKQREGAK